VSYAGELVAKCIYLPLKLQVLVLRCPEVGFDTFHVSAGEITGPQLVNVEAWGPSFLAGAATRYSPIAPGLSSMTSIASLHPCGVVA
jgi:hypothetical protein